MKKSLENSEQYTWGDNCSGWELVKSETLSVIEESMPPNTSEVRHYHSKVQQFFYVLKGEATFEIGNEILKVSRREGLHVEPKVIHQIRNEGETNLEFLVISQPTSRGDRINME